MRKYIFLLSIVLLFTSLSSAKEKGNIQIFCEPHVEIYLDSFLIGESDSASKGFFLEDVAFGNHVLELIKNDIIDQYVFELVDTLVAIRSKMFPHEKKYDVAPEMIYSVTPVYPAFAATARQEGTVVINALIDTLGYVIKSEVLISSGFQSLDAAALNIAHKNKFKPGIYQGKPIECWVTYDVGFNLD